MEQHRGHDMWKSIVAIVLAITAAAAFIFNALVCMIIMKRDDYVPK
ncbi:MAG: hypothetical protein ACLRVT_04805 [Oscillospiraceae bacterium]